MPERRFPPPWTVEEYRGISYIVRDANRFAVAYVYFESWLCKNSTRYNRTRNFGLYGHAESKKTQKFVFRSALRPNQISFSHGQDHKAVTKAMRGVDYVHHNVALVPLAKAGNRFW